MTFFLENLWFWFLLAFAAAGAGVYIFLEQRTLKPLAGAASAALAILALGVTLVWFVPTPRKSIIAVLDGISDRIVANDLAGVQAHLAPKAVNLRRLAEAGLGRVTVDKAKFSDLKIEIDEHTSPVTAKVAFTATFLYRFHPTDKQSFPARVKLRIEMERTPTGWLLTDNYFADELGSVF